MTATGRGLVVMLFLAVGAFIVVRCCNGSEPVDRFDWKTFIDALEAVEAPKTVEQEEAAIKREGAYGKLQIRQPVLTDVNSKYGTDVTLDKVRNSRTLSVWVCVHYLRMYKATDSYEEAARTWNGGPDGPREPETEAHWLKVKAALIERGIELE
jgi:hypothetical protein